MNWGTSIFSLTCVMSIKTEVIIVPMISVDISGLPLGSYFFFLSNCLFLFCSFLDVDVDQIALDYICKFMTV